jgi:hypothetical protein
LGVGGFVSSLLRGGRESGVDVADEDALAEVSASGFTKLGGLGVGFGGGSGDVETGDAAVEPEAGDIGKVGGGDFGIEIEQNADVVTAGFMDKVVEIVECAVGWVDGLGMGSVWLDDREQKGVDAKGLDVVEMLGDAMETAAARGTEVDGVDLVDDGMLPPDVGADAGAGPAGACKDLGFSVWSEGRRDDETSEAEGEESVECGCDHALYLRCYARRRMGGIDGLCAWGNSSGRLTEVHMARGKNLMNLYFVGEKLYGSKKRIQQNRRFA